MLSFAISSPFPLLASQSLAVFEDNTHLFSSLIFDFWNHSCCMLVIALTFRESTLTFGVARLSRSSYREREGL